jgi:hypothetical protein
MKLLQKKNLFIVVLIVAVLAVSIFVFAVVRGQSSYYVHLLRCKGTFISSQTNYSNHGSVDAAKQYADSNLGGNYDIAYVLDGARSRVLWARSTGACYGAATWFEPGP